VLPLFALRNGHLLSGHQRLQVAQEMGCSHVPVVFLDTPESRLRGINLLFNRCTNDMRSTDTSETLVRTLPINQLNEMLDAVPDKTPASPEFFRCMNPEMLPVNDLLAKVTKSFETNTVGACRKLFGLGGTMPVVINEQGDVVNGSYRLMALAEEKATLVRTGKWSDTFPAIRLTAAEAAIADILINLISMNFTLEKQYADMLRWGSFRRPTNKVTDLPQSYRILINNWKTQSAKRDLEESDKFWHAFRKHYGETIVDFGAGARRVKPILEAKGIHCIEFEPYPLDWRDEMQDGKPKDVPNLELARKLTDEFLADLASGRQYSSVMIAAVLNSVPFYKDRMCVLAVTHALCGINSQLVGQTRSYENTSSVNYLKNRTDPCGHHAPSPSTFMLDYEPNITLGDAGRAPKVQKAHSPDEVKAMLNPFYGKIEITASSNYIWFRGRYPKRVNPKVLTAAITEEFNLPYADGSRLDRVDAALAAFSKRLGVKLGE
jgi:hypothetical protein